jgi:hypothetical protein
MSSDFGAELDTALSAHVAQLRAIAEKAKERIDQGVAGAVTRAPAQPVAQAPDPEDPYDAPRRSGPAVSFDVDEAEFDPAALEALAFDSPVDGEGVPLPEDI